ncbi:hypothetical protein HZA85_01250 [Candidatus Uhrbacteria bacterium]|nr:hypothetical protein [Candidatus Uhrbacteria bacterium]
MFSFSRHLILVLVLLFACPLWTSACSTDSEVVGPTGPTLVTDGLGLEVPTQPDAASNETPVADAALDNVEDTELPDAPTEVSAQDAPEVDTAPACTNKEDCDDKNACTEDGCNQLTGQCAHVVQIYFSCDDKNACTQDDRCNEQGECLGNQKTLCFDGNPCTLDTCDKNGGCVFSNIDVPCNDNNACTNDDQCQNGACAGVPIVCDDKNPCTADTCNPKTGCVFQQENNVPCDDNNACTSADQCASGICKGSPINCGDGNSCTVDSCDKQSGCYSTPAVNNTTCSDGDGCTLKDVCIDSVCKSGAKKNCDDNNVCTNDACDSSDGQCLHEVLPGIHYCDDNNACTNTDTCKLGVCTGKIVQCYDGNDCTLDTCDMKAGCLFLAQDKAPCDDGNKCTLGDICAQTKCEGKVISCDDGNVCTNDTCDPAVGACNHTAATGYYCNDGNACTIGDVCEGATCVGKTLACTDGNPCTDDSCNPKTGCFFVPTPNAPCNDGNLCTKDDICNQSVCVGKPISCDDSNSCTLDSCDKTTGVCQNVQLKDGYACNDADACTYGDSCSAGKCVGIVNDCDDMDKCTKDACNPQTGKCVHAQIPNCS